MFNDHTAVMLIIDPESGRILDVNPAACEFYGYEKAELLALSIQDINTLSAEETARLRKRALQRGQGHFIMPHRRKNGEVRIVEVLSCPFDNQDGRKLFSITFDVTDRETYRENLFREKELLNTTLRSIGDGVVTIDTKGRITSINKAAEEIILFGTDEVVGRPFREVFRLIREKDGQPAADPAQTVLETGKARSVASNTAVLNKRGERISISDSASPIINEKGELLGVVVVFRDVRAEKAREKEVTFLSSHDPLTGLYNRRHMECALRCLDESACVPVSIVMGDVNGLKIANDVFSHETGDRLLERVSAVLRECAGSGDVIARWGGDEFLMALPNVPVEDAEAMIRRLKARLREQSKGITPLSVSFGCAEKTTPDQRIGEVIRKAEERMYHQKLLESKTYRNAIVSSLMASLYEKSLESKEHAERLGKYCRAIGEELALSDRELNELALLSVLHDIGKVGIKQEILQKTGELTQEEKTEVKKHSEIGYRIALNTPELIDVSELILSHHEHWDGTGYPSGLAGTQIPLSCRILSVVDAYDAMTNDRVYRKAMPKREAIRELREHAGSQFDPAIVEVFLPIVTNEQPDAQTDPGQNLLC
jgi:diguanylate cyclase (GGDEF)-like protein/PAS domain S-box-containing protein